MKARNSIILFILVFLVAALSACSSREEKRDHFMKRGASLEKSHKLLRARVEYKNAVQVDPNCVNCLLSLARVEMELGNLRNAYQAFSTALQLAPDRSDIKLSLAKLYLVTRSGDKAEKLCAEVLETEPENTKAKLLYGLSLAAQKDKADRAKEVLLSFLKEHPDMQEPYIALAGIYEREGNVDRAVALLKSAEGKTSNDQGIKQALVRVYAMGGDIDSALSIANELESKQPESASIELLIARLLEQKGDIESAREHWEKALTKAKDHLVKKRILLGYVQFLGRHGLAKNAENTVKKAFEKSPSDIELRIALIRVLVWQRKWKEALKLLDSTDFNGLNEGEKVAILNEKAKVHLAMGGLKESKQFADQALKINAKDAQALFVKAKIALIEKDGKEAVSLLRRLIADDPQNVRYRMMLATAHVLNKELKLAEDQYRKVVRIDPKNVAAWTSLVKFYLMQKNNDSARDAVQEAIQNVPDSPLLYDLNGWVCAAEGNADCAMESFKKAIELAPNWLVPYRDLARLYASAGDLKRAEQALKDAVKTLPKSAQPKVLLASFYEQVGRTEDAINIYEELVRHGTKNPFLLNNLAYLISVSTDDHKKLIEAKEYAEKAQSLMPDQPNIMDTNAWILFKLGEKETALKLLNRALEKNSEDPAILYHKAYILNDLGDKVGAKKILEGLRARKGWYPEKKEAEALYKAL